MGKAKYVSLALRHADKLPKKSKKILGIAIAVLVILVIVVAGLLIALIIWLTNSLSNADAVTQTIDKAKEVTSRQIQGANPQDYIQNGQVNADKLREHIKSLSPEHLIVFTTQFNEQITKLVESGQLLQSQAEQLQQVLP